VSTSRPSGNRPGPRAGAPHRGGAAARRGASAVRTGRSHAGRVSTPERDISRKERKERNAARHKTLRAAAVEKRSKKRSHRSAKRRAAKQAEVAAKQSGATGQSQQAQSDSPAAGTPVVPEAPADPAKPLFSDYQPLDGAYDELFGSANHPRAGAAPVVASLDALGQAEFERRQKLADQLFLRGGITFSVYSDNRGVEKIFPFDLIPRIVTSDEWDVLEKGLVQRITALNAFLNDVYGKQAILRDKVIPRDLVETSAGYRPVLRGIKPRGGVYVHVGGIDLIRDEHGTFIVLEDNVRTPSGVSYVLENRSVMKRVLPRIFAESHVRAVDDYPAKLRDALHELSPVPAEDTRAVVLTPGTFNSAYFEHSFLARRMGVELVQPSDLFVHGDHVYVKTTGGPARVDVIYRRVDDEFLDPELFRPDSLLGVPGLASIYAKGNVTLANALGNGVADDKGIYPFVPAMVRYYLKEEALLGQVETLSCADDTERKRVLDNLSRMVVKAVDASGGYGMLMGHQATKAQLTEFAGRIRANPRGYIAQPLISLSTAPTWCAGANGAPSSVEPRRVDLRPYIVTGKKTWVLPGGLSRVALVKGSYVVNSSQGGGSKDSWVLEGGRA
jgi:uncharacterized circularly permuted ATP-grasp superfamily protein